MELEALQEVNEKIETRGGRLVAISPQLDKYSKQVVKKHQLTFPVLGDKDNKTAAQFGLVFTLPEPLQELYTSFGLDLPRFNGNDSWTLPLPGRFVVGTDGIIKNREVHPDYTRRPEPAEIPELLSSLA